MRTLWNTLNESLVKNIGIGKRPYVIDWAAKHVQGFKKSMGEQTYSVNQVYIDSDCRICMSKDAMMSTIIVDTVDVPNEIKFSECHTFWIFTPKGEPTHKLEDADFIPPCGTLTLQNIYIAGTINMYETWYKDSRIQLYDCLARNAVLNFPKAARRKYLFTDNYVDLPSIKSNCDTIEINQIGIWDHIQQKKDADSVIKEFITKSNFPNVKDVILKVGLSRDPHYILKNNHWVEV